MRKVIRFFILFLFSVFLFAGIQSNAFAQATFSPKTDFAAGTQPITSTVCDLNNDGKQDIATINSLSGTCSFYMNTTAPGAATPTFSIPTALTTGANPQFVTNADMNGDGKQDLLITLSAGSISIYLNTTIPGAASPTFGAGEDFTVGNLPIFAITADFNYDGIPDLAVANASGNSLSAFINFTIPGTTDVNLSGALTVPMANFPFSLTTADFNGDGKQDLACSRGVGGATPISILLNTTEWGDPTPLFSVTEIASDISPAGISAGDINGDGKPDLAIGSEGSNNISVLMNTTTTGASTPTFASVVNFPAGSTPSNVKIVDMNCDGRPDVILTNFASSSVGVYLNITVPGAAVPDFAPRSDFLSGASPFHITTGDFNGDFRPDMVSTNYADANISVFLNTMTLGVNPPEFSVKTDFTVPDIIQALLSDFNGDGRPDAATVSTVSNSISVLLNTTSPGAVIPAFGSVTNFDSDTMPVAIVSADFNTDGKPDIATANDSGSFSVFMNRTIPGSSTPEFTVRMDQPTGKLSSIAVADLNGEGQPDIVASNYVDNRVEVMINKTIPADTMPVFLDTVSFGTGLNPGPIALADINNDGRPDIIVGNRSDFFLSVLINTTEAGLSLPTFTARTDFPSQSGVHSISTADFNCDGKLDLFTANTFSNTHSIYLNTTAPGDTVPSFSSAFTYVTGGVRTVVGDFNGDGKPDISATIFNSNLTFIRLNLTTPGASTPLFSGRTNLGTGVNPQSIAAADINGDGKPDLLASNINDGTFSVFLNTADYPLPVELSSFSASVRDNSVSLFWTTVSEENNSGFDIERSSFGTGWTKIGFAAGRGTTNVPQNYSFTDNGLNAGAYHYRLKQIDYNGNYKYYNLQNEVLVGVPGKFSLSQNYPNPFNPSTIINYQLPVNGFVSLKIYDIAGREVMQLVNEIQQAGYYAVNFNARSFASGTYFYRLSTDRFSDVKKMVVIK